MTVPIDDPELLKLALTHRSAADDPIRKSNERLEFFGDAVIGMVISEYLHEEFPDWDQGRLSKAKAAAVQESALAEAGLALGLDGLVRIGPGEELTGGRQRNSILCDAFEAVVGAVYREKGLDPAREFILELLAPSLERIASGEIMLTDFKSRLQELAQARWKTTPSYRVTAEDGTPHERDFSIQVAINGEVLGEGRGHSKKEAEQMAASQALSRLENETLGME